MQEDEFGLTAISGRGVMIYDGEDGRFELRLASVHALLAPPEQQGR